MGLSIVEMVLFRLREAGFTADIAYPGQKYPKITEPVVAVHIEQVDRANLTVTLEATVVCPADMGGTACELEALKATDVLRWAGGVCIQNGCSYDGITQTYMVSVMATFTCVTDGETCTVWPGFYCLLNGTLQRSAIRFHTEEETGCQAEYVTGEAAPAEILPGSGHWQIELEELIPAGSEEPGDTREAFRLEIITDRKVERYNNCWWTYVSREYSRQGLRRLRKGFALTREEEIIGEA